MRRSFHRRAAALGLLLGWLTGCEPSTSTNGTDTTTPVALAAACDDPGLARELTTRGVRVEPRSAATDIVIARPSELGALAAAGDLLPVPDALRADGHPLQYRQIGEAFRTTLAGWGGKIVALPLTGDGFALVYRTDRLSGPPGTWEDLADAAETAFAADGKPSLPPLPTDPERLLTLFHQIAACYDRPASAGVRGAAATGFHVHPDTWEPRLVAPAFAAAADWLNRTAKFRPPAGTAYDPVAALDAGTAVAAVLSLAEIGKLPRDPDTGTVSKKFGLANLPGTRTVFAADGTPTVAGRGGNYVPFLGAGGRVGVVFARCANPDAAWAVLADLAGPERTRARLSDPAAGVGPTRTDNTGSAWLRYGFDPDRTAALGKAMADYAGTGNRAVVLRTPDQAELMAALAAEVRRAAEGKATGAEAMAAAAAAWKRLDAKRNPDDLIRWRRNAAGLP